MSGVTVRDILLEGGTVRVVVAPKETRVVQITPKERHVVQINRGPAGVPGEDGTAAEYFDQFELSSDEIADKKIVLTSVPAFPERVEFSVKGAPTLFFGDDYTIVDDELSWSGLGLDGLLEVGDKVKIRFLV